jgi:3-(methylthio)propanoyl-CoA dehydrogenase
VDHAGDPDAKLAGASPYLRMLASTLGGFLLARSTLAARQAGHPLAEAKRAIACFYATQLLPPAAALLPAVTAGSTPLEAPLA